MSGGRLRFTLLFSVIFSVLSTSIEIPVLTALRVFPPTMRTGSLAGALSTLLVYSFHGALIRYWAVVGVQAVARSLSHSSQLAAQLSAAQLGALKMQLRPHFLFNTLGAITALVRQSRTREAEAMIGRLSDLLRLTLEDVNTQEVPVWRELDFLRTYLSIEQARFSDRLRVDIVADPEVSEALVPHMVLQPIVENAIRHALGESEQAVRIRISAIRMGEDLVLTVTDDGPGSAAGFAGKGIGLTNTRDRLQHLYGDRASLIAGNRAPRGVEVTVRVPFHVGEGECA